MSILLCRPAHPHLRVSVGITAHKVCFSLVLPVMFYSMHFDMGLCSALETHAYF